MTFWIICSLLLQTATLIRLHQVNNKLEDIEVGLQERFDAVNAALQEASDEILAELEKLRNMTLPPEAEASLAAIEAKANALKDVSPPLP